METTYGIGVKNRYDIFYNEDVDPLEILKQQELERQKQRERKEKDKSSKDNKTITPAKINTKKIINQQPAKPPQEIPPTKKEVQENKPKSSSRQNERNVKFSPNTREQPQDVEERNNRKNREERTIPTTEFNRDLSGEIRGRGRGGNARGGNRARGRGRGTFENRGGFDNRGKREFDRQSGSDKRYSDHYSSVKAVDKRDGAGSHNWGTIRDDIDDQMHETTVTEETSDWGAVERPEEPETVEKKEPVETEIPEQTVEMEEEVKEMTLDEWKKQQERLRSRSNFRLRKAGEGEDNTQWKKTFLLKKTAGAESGDEEEEEEVSSSELELEEESVRRGRQKHLVEIEINFSDSRRSRGRGGRGGVGNRGSRGGRGGRGNARGRGTPGSAAPKVDDENDFPSLVK